MPTKQSGEKDLYEQMSKECLRACRAFVRNQSDEELDRLMLAWATKRIESEKPSYTNRGVKKQQAKMLLYQFAMAGLYGARRAVCHPPDETRQD